MDYKVVLTEPAIEDIDQTVSYIKLHSAPGAARWLDGFQMIIASLGEMPRRAAKIPETPNSRMEYRHLIYHSHRIVFRIDETTNTVYVVRVYHTSRSPLQAENLS